MPNKSDIRVESRVTVQGGGQPKQTEEDVIYVGHGGQEADQHGAPKPDYKKGERWSV